MTLNSILLLSFDLRTRYLDQGMSFRSCGIWKTAIGYFGHVHVAAHDGLFQLYLTCLCCNWSRHVEDLQQMSCGFYRGDSAITSTMYASGDSPDVVIASLVHSRGPVSPKTFGNIPNLTTLEYSIVWTVQTDALVDHGSASLHAVMNWSCCSPCKPAGYSIVRRWPSISKRIGSHHI